MSLKLGPIQALVEREFLDDDLVIYQPGAGSKVTSVLDEVTGKLVPVVPEPIWSGKGAIFPAGYSGAIPGVPDQRVPNETDADYKVLLPLAADDVPVNAVVVAVTALRDPLLVGKQVRLTEMPPVSTFNVVRVCAARRLDATDPDAIPEDAIGYGKGGYGDGGYGT